MYYTPEEARKKICPLGHPQQCKQAEHEPFCVATSCMSWRWGSRGQNVNKGYCGLCGMPMRQGRVDK